ncbi:hypothetical protein KQX54_002855 [Cotesia glomerata]|uniref:Uncharacterized protein n=1 Tax=Cotesia glomerata TaxID=32391 RepID=A0AAV7J5N5_COTGL|nr:hypothetical protein KQX54_002855 [Cotesia glomerata]
MEHRTPDSAKNHRAEMMTGQTAPGPKKPNSQRKNKEYFEGQKAIQEGKGDEQMSLAFLATNRLTWKFSHHKINKNTWTLCDLGSGNCNENGNCRSMNYACQGSFGHATLRIDRSDRSYVSRVLLFVSGLVAASTFTICTYVFICTYSVICGTRFTIRRL